MYISYNILTFNITNIILLHLMCRKVRKYNKTYIYIYLHMLRLV